MNAAVEEKSDVIVVNIAPAILIFKINIKTSLDMGR